MKTIFTMLFYCMSAAVFSQEKTQAQYLLVRIDGGYNKPAKQYYSMINAEPGCDSAGIFYGLKKFDVKKDAVNTEAVLYPGKNDSVHLYYNYFSTPTQALNFISKNGWELVNIYTETFSGSTIADNGNIEQRYPITTVSSRPVYCFKKSVLWGR